MRMVFIAISVAAVAFQLMSDDVKKVYDMSAVRTSKEAAAFISTYLLTWINSDLIVTAVQQVNAEFARRTIDEVKAVDKEWMSSRDLTPLQRRFIENPVSDLLRKKMKDTSGLIAEAFIMDFQGCIVAAAKKTSDYWQGDEDKFIKSYGTGGSIFIDKVRYDESTGTASMQVSLPIFDAKAKRVIGAITIGIDMHKRALLKNYVQ
ncbi:MAG: hypothetical protein HZC28_07290 [Spirochaetes bacterium]|nr:hypothetical protein [Spirochaetota bacterium]